MTTKIKQRQVGGEGFDSLKQQLQDVTEHREQVDGLIATLRTDVDEHAGQFPTILADIQELKDRPTGGGTTVGGGGGGIDLVVLNSLVYNNIRDLEGRAAEKVRYDNMVVDAFTTNAGMDLALSQGVVLASGTVRQGQSDITPLMTSDTTPAPYITSADTSFGATSPWKALDNTTAYWYTSVSTPVDVTLGHWWKLNFGTQKFIGKIALKSFPYSGTVHTIKDFIVWGSNNNSTWTELYRATHPNDAVLKEYTLTSPGNYQWYRISFPNGSYGDTTVSGIEEIKFYENSQNSVLITKAETFTTKPTKMIVFGEYTGTLTCDVSLDNGTTWKTGVAFGELFDTSSMASNGQMRIRVAINAQGLRSLAYAWYDDSDFISMAPQVDPALGSMVLNNTVNLLKSNFRSAEQRTASKYAWKNFVVDVFTDANGIEIGMGSLSGGKLIQPAPNKIIGAGGTPSASSSLSNMPVTGAFDQNASTTWANSNAVMPVWLQYEFLNTQRITAYALTIGSSATQVPVDFTIQGWNGTAWDILDTRTGVTWTANERKQFPLTQIGNYQRYRMHVTKAIAVSGYEYVVINEFELLASDPVTSIITKTDIATTPPKKMVLVTEHTGTVTYDISTDNGTTWKTNVALNEFIDLSDNTGTQIKIRININNNAEVLSLGYAWFDNSLNLATSSGIDPGTVTRIENLEYNLAKSLLKIATLENASRYSMKGIIIEEFNDDTGIDKSKSSAFSMSSKRLTSEPANIASIASNGGTITVSSSYSGSSSALNLIDGSFATANTFSDRTGLVVRTFAAPVPSIVGVNVHFEKPAQSQTVTYTAEGFINGAWTMLGQYTTQSSVLTAGRNKCEIRFNEVTTSQIRITGVNAVDWVAMYEIEILQPIGGASVVSVSEDVSVAPTKAMVLSKSQLSGGATVKYFVSRDDGVTWTEVQNETLTDISGQPTGTKLRIKIDITGMAAVENYALMWR